MQIRQATLEDVTQIAQLEQESFSVPWSKDAIQKDLENPVAMYIVAEKDSRLVGYVGVWCVLDEGQITNVAVHKDYRRRGVGKQLIDALIETTRARQLCTLLLEVRQSNLAAQKLYESCQFEVIAVRKNYYNKPTEDALIMQMNM